MATQTKAQVLETLQGLMPELIEGIVKQAKEALDSGAIELSEFEHAGEYKLPKMLLSAVLKKQADKFTPPHPSNADKKFLKNLANFI